MTFNKGFAWLPILIVAGVVIIGAAVYVYSPLPQGSTTQSDITGTNTPPHAQPTTPAPVTHSTSLPATAAASIDQGSLTTNSPSPTITGTVSGTSNIHIQVGGSQGLSSETGGVIIKNGHWSASFGTFSPGTYPVSIIDFTNKKVLATGTLVVGAYSGPQGLLQAPGSNAQASSTQ